MDSRETGEELPVTGIPEDVAVLYSWANLKNAKYRDFSASRREYRAQIRYRAAQDLRERELRAQEAAEESAVAAEQAALAAEAAVRQQSSNDSLVLRVQALRDAESAARKASAERVEASRRAEAAANADAVALHEEREIADARRSAQRQAERYAERHLHMSQSRTVVPGRLGDPYTHSTALLDDESEEWAAKPAHFLPPRRYKARDESESGALHALSQEASELRRPQGYHPDDASAMWTTVPALAFSPETLAGPELVRDQVTMRHALGRVGLGVGADHLTDTLLSEEEDRPGPAWFYGPHSPLADSPAADTPVPDSSPSQTRVAPASARPAGRDTLQDSRERVAARWFALKGVFGQSGPELPVLQPVLPGETRTPLLLVFSLAGGVGKTSLVATLGRALSSHGEKVLLTDTTSHGLLPFYFGAHELGPGTVRTFSAPPGSNDAPIVLVSYDATTHLPRNGVVAHQQETAHHQDGLMDEILRNAQESNRVVLDLSAGAGWLIRRIASLQPTVLVPVAPDMNSVISLQAVERFFQGITDADGRPLLPFYLLSQFDWTLPLHLDVREVLRRQLGDRLLSFVIRRSPAVSEALAEGMTVVDYAPEAPVSKDYFEVARWLRSISPAAMEGFRPRPWNPKHGGDDRWSDG
jgi:cellulose synthase operon protein YhjQ